MISVHHFYIDRFENEQSLNNNSYHYRGALRVHFLQNKLKDLLLLRDILQIDLLCPH